LWQAVAVSYLGKLIYIFKNMCGNDVSTYRLIDRIHNTSTFIAYSFLLRGFEALGAAAYSTASYTFVADVFPDHIGPVMGILETFSQNKLTLVDWWIWTSFLHTWSCDGFICAGQHSTSSSR